MYLTVSYEAVGNKAECDIHIGNSSSKTRRHTQKTRQEIASTMLLRV